MDHFGNHQKNNFLSSSEEMPHPPKGDEAKAGTELVDTMLPKGGGYGSSEKICTKAASSPSSRRGTRESPPSRVSNPLVRDPLFGKISALSMIPNPALAGLQLWPSSSAMKGGCLHANFGDNPAARIEGFGGYGLSEPIVTQVASSPPFYIGSPPSRVSNPDPCFGDVKISPVSPRFLIPNPDSAGLQASPSSSEMKGGCLRANSGNKPAVRIEGFDCLDGDDRRNCNIPTRA